VRYGLPAARAFYRGVAHYEAGRYEQARERFTEAAQRNPDYAEAWAYVGRIAFEAGNYEEAERAYGEASTLRPDNATYRYFLEEARRRMGQDT
jgi:tetratricopeptide (TPR) repeat protein